MPLYKINNNKLELAKPVEFKLEKELHTLLQANKQQTEDAESHLLLRLTMGPKFLELVAEEEETESGEATEAIYDKLLRQAVMRANNDGAAANLSHLRLDLKSNQHGIYVEAELRSRQPSSGSP